MGTIILPYFMALLVILLSNLPNCIISALNTLPNHPNSVIISYQIKKPLDLLIHHTNMLLADHLCDQSNKNPMLNWCVKYRSRDILYPETDFVLFDVSSLESPNIISQNLTDSVISHLKLLISHNVTYPINNIVPNVSKVNFKLQEYVDNYGQSDLHSFSTSNSRSTFSSPPTSRLPKYNPLMASWNREFRALFATNARRQWGLGRRGQGVKIGVMDTGLHPNHPCIAAVDLTNWTDEHDVSDAVGHGSFVAGVISAVGPGQCYGHRKQSPFNRRILPSRDCSNPDHCIGMSPDVDLYVLKVFTQSLTSFTSWFLDAFNYAMYIQLDIINLSVGGPDHADVLYTRKVEEVVAAGITIVSAMGNDGPLWGTLNNPGDMIEVIGVGGTTSKNQLASFSSRGMVTWDLPHAYGRVGVDVVTYGTDIRSTKPYNAPIVLNNYNLNQSNNVHTLNIDPHVRSSTSDRVGSNSGNSRMSPLQNNPHPSSPSSHSSPITCEYASMSGTSVAAPIITSMLALLLSGIPQHVSVGLPDLNMDLVSDFHSHKPSISETVSVDCTGNDCSHNHGINSSVGTGDSDSLDFINTQEIIVDLSDSSNTTLSSSSTLLRPLSQLKYNLNMTTNFNRSPLSAAALTLRHLPSVSRWLSIPRRALYTPSLLKMLLLQASSPTPGSLHGDKEGSSIFEQGQGLVNLDLLIHHTSNLHPNMWLPARVVEVRKENRGEHSSLHPLHHPPSPNALPLFTLPPSPLTPQALPSSLHLHECPYAWPYCLQPLYATSQPIVVNTTLVAHTHASLVHYDVKIHDIDRVVSGYRRRIMSGPVVDGGEESVIGWNDHMLSVLVDLSKPQLKNGFGDVGISFSVRDGMDEYIRNLITNSTVNNIANSTSTSHTQSTDASPSPNDGPFKHYDTRLDSFLLVSGEVVLYVETLHPSTSNPFLKHTHRLHKSRLKSDSYSKSASQSRIPFTSLHRVTIPFTITVIPTPPRAKRVAIDAFYQLHYPSAYIPRDDLTDRQLLLDWHGDHPYTNLKPTYMTLVKKGFFVDVMHLDLSCFDASSYGILMIIDPERDFTHSESVKLEIDVKERGLSVLVVADWFNKDIMNSIVFRDTNTDAVWTPLTGGANVPGINRLLSGFGIAFGDHVYSGKMRFGHQHAEVKSGSSIVRFPRGGRLALTMLYDVTPNIDYTVHSNPFSSTSFPTDNLNSDVHLDRDSPPSVEKLTRPSPSPIDPRVSSRADVIGSALADFVSTPQTRIEAVLDTKRSKKHLVAPIGIYQTTPHPLSPHHRVFNYTALELHTHSHKPAADLTQFTIPSSLNAPSSSSTGSRLNQTVIWPPPSGRIAVIGDSDCLGSGRGSLCTGVMLRLIEYLSSGSIDAKIPLTTLTHNFIMRKYQYGGLPAALALTTDKSASVSSDPSPSSPSSPPSPSDHNHLDVDAIHVMDIATDVCGEQWMVDDVTRCLFWSKFDSFKAKYKPSTYSAYSTYQSSSQSPLESFHAFPGALPNELNPVYQKKKLDESLFKFQTTSPANRDDVEISSNNDVLNNTCWIEPLSTHLPLSRVMFPHNHLLYSPTSPSHPSRSSISPYMNNNNELRNYYHYPTTAESSQGSFSRVNNESVHPEYAHSSPVCSTSQSTVYSTASPLLRKRVLRVVEWWTEHERLPQCPLSLIDSAVVAVASFTHSLTHSLPRNITTSLYVSLDDIDSESEDIAVDSDLYTSMVTAVALLNSDLDNNNAGFKTYFSTNHHVQHSSIDAESLLSKTTGKSGGNVKHKKRESIDRNIDADNVKDSSSQTVKSPTIPTNSEDSVDINV